MVYYKLGRFQWSKSAVQDNFVSYTVKAEEQANMDRISIQKSRTAISTPLEPLIVSLLKCYTDDSDLVSKLKALYTASVVVRRGWEKGRRDEIARLVQKRSYRNQGKREATKKKGTECSVQLDF
jgi:hypothetical protein